MGFMPGVRVILESDDSTIKELPGFYSIPRKGETLRLSLDNGDEVDYKVKKIVTSIHGITNLNTPGRETRVTYDAKVHIIVSPV